MSGSQAAVRYMVPGVIPDISDGGSIGTVSSNTANQASLVLTLSQIAEAGRLVVLIIAVDNNQTTDGDEGAVTGVTDSVGGNTWTKVMEFCNGQSGAQLGATCSMWRSILTNQLNVGSTITASFSNTASRDASAATARKFAPAPGKVFSAEGTSASLANDGADPGSLNVTTTGAQACLRIRGIAQENNASAITPTSGWTSFGGANTTGGSAATNMAVLGEFKISTETSSASDPTSAAADTASVYACFKAT